MADITLVSLSNLGAVSGTPIVHADNGTSEGYYTLDNILQYYIDDAGTSASDLWSASKISTELSGKASVTHSHSISDISGLQAALNAKASTTHSHSISAVNGLQTALDAKASITHCHTVGQIVGLTLGSLSDVSITTTPTTSSYLFYNTASGKFEASGTPIAAGGATALGDLTDVSLTTTPTASAYLFYNATSGKFEASTVGYAAGGASVGHSHCVSDVAGLQAALDAKASITHCHTVGQIVGLELSALSDISLTTTPTASAYLFYNATSGKFEASSTGYSAGGASALNDLSDVSVTATPANGAPLVYDQSQSKWVAATSSLGPTEGEIVAGVSVTGSVQWQSVDPRTLFPEAFERSWTLVISGDDTQVLDAKLSYALLNGGKFEIVETSGAGHISIRANGTTITGGGSITLSLTGSITLSGIAVDAKLDVVTTSLSGSTAVCRLTYWT